MRGITKRFPGIVANDDVDFDLLPGEVHALLGENGAGKSTLMNILYGLYTPDEGEIVVKGKPVRMESPRDAIANGIGMVHQHFMLIPVMTVAENIVLGEEPRRDGVLLDFEKAERRVDELARSFKFSIDPRARVENLSVGTQQRVEILKALYRSADILILDEPTAVLTPPEARELFEILRTLIARGDGGDLHQPQAGRGAPDLRSDHDAPPRQADRHRRARGRDRGRACQGDGRPRGAAARRQEAVRAGRGDPGGREPLRPRRPRPPCGARRVVRGARRRDRRDRGRRRQRPDRADRRADRPEARRSRDASRSPART